VELHIQLMLADDALVRDLFAGSGAKSGASIQVPGGAVLTFHGANNIETRDVAGMSFVLELGLSLGTSVVGSLVASWLYDKLKCARRGARLMIDRTEIRIEKGEIERVIVEHTRGGRAVDGAEPSIPRSRSRGREPGW
jgi:hypothetical protein